MRGLRGDYFDGPAAAGDSEDRRREPVPQHPIEPQPIASPAAPLGARRHANSTKEILDAIEDFAKWMAHWVEETPDLAACQTLVLPELPPWYLQVVSGLAPRQVAAPPGRVWGTTDMLTADQIQSLAAMVLPPALDLAGRGIRRLWADRGRPTLDAVDVVAALVTTLGAELTSAGRDTRHPIVMTRPELIAPARSRDQLVLLIHTSLSSILWRSQWSRRSRRLVGGWLLIDGDGTLRGAALYPRQAREDSTAAATPSFATSTSEKNGASALST